MITQQTLFDACEKLKEKGTYDFDDVDEPSVGDSCLNDMAQELSMAVGESSQTKALEFCSWLNGYIEGVEDNWDDFEFKAHLTSKAMAVIKKRVQEVLSK